MKPGAGAVVENRSPRIRLAPHAVDEEPVVVVRRRHCLEILGTGRWLRFAAGECGRWGRTWTGSPHRGQQAASGDGHGHDEGRRAHQADGQTRAAEFTHGAELPQTEVTQVVEAVVVAGV